jgi:hypothetical protein
MSSNEFFPQFRFILIHFLILLFCSCAQKSDKATQLSDTTQDTIITDEYPQQASEANSERYIDLIQFNGTERDEVRKMLEIFPPFVAVYESFGEYVRLQDSLEQVRELWGQPLTDPEDTLMVFPYKEIAYNAILDYRKQMASGAALEGRCPTLLELTRVPMPHDSSLSLLPEVGKSDLLSQGNFFFLGGAPFLSKRFAEDGDSIMTDLKGHPETRFGMTLQDNANFLLTSVYCARPTAIRIEYGPPLHSYETGPLEIYGIGSLIHQFVQRVPVFFITEEGLLPGHLLSAELNLAPSYNCGSGEVYIELACAEPIEANDILGVYIPYGPSPTSYAFNRVSDQVWTVDLNNDGTPDIACVYDSYAAYSTDVIAESLWFANINGNWKIIDWAEHPECT